MAIIILFIANGCGSQPTGSSNPKKKKNNDAMKAAAKITSHPVFHTVVSGQPQSRPAIQIDILDDSEDWIFRAELYLSIQSSRFPQDTRVLIPLNRGDFAGIRKRFTQLPFEVQKGDTLVFNLLDDDKLTQEQEQSLLLGCRSAGYCLLIAGSIYCPNAAYIAEPVVEVASEILGQAIIQDIDLHGFENFGTAEYIVQKSLPKQPYEANELSIRNPAHNVPAVLKVYGPAEALPFKFENAR